MDFSDNTEKKNKNIFDRFKKEPKGVSKDEKPPIADPSLENFFKSSFRNLNRLFSVNLVYIFGNFPIFFLLLAVSGYVSLSSTAPFYQLFAPVKAAAYASTDPVTSSLLGIFGAQASITVSTVWTKIAYGVSALTLLTFGPVNVGCAHILRSVFRGDPIFFFSDFFGAIRRNLKQSLIFGVIDAALTLMLAYDIVYFNVRMAESMVMSIMFFMSIVMLVLYMFARMYIYPMMITFELPFGKLIKNGVFFALLGIKRNLMALLGCVIIAAIEFVLFAIYPPIAVILPFVIVFGLVGYMGIYCAYPKIKEVMIDPYYSDSDGE